VEKERFETGRALPGRKMFGGLEMAAAVLLITTSK
jgi:hypothetical protein